MTPEERLEEIEQAEKQEQRLSDIEALLTGLVEYHNIADSLQYRQTNAWLSYLNIKERAK